MLWGILALSMVNTIIGLFIFACGLATTVRYPFWEHTAQAQRHNPGNPTSFRGLLIGLYIVLFILTVIGCTLLISKVLGPELRTVADLATITSVVQGFVYGTAGLVIGLLSYRS